MALSVSTRRYRPHRDPGRHLPRDCGRRMGVLDDHSGLAMVKVGFSVWD
jgi:hypothetical protein